MDRLLALPWSTLGVGALSLVLCLVLFVAWILARRPVQRIDAIVAGRGPLRRGAASIGGEVELAPDELLPLDVKITQTGAPKTIFYSPKENVRDVRRVHYMKWETVGEEVVARPFFVRRADGERVRVEPPPNVKFRGKMDVCVEHTEHLCTFEARLRPGDKVYIEGTLSRPEPRPRPPEPEPEPERKGGGYRAAAPREREEVADEPPPMWVLGPPEGKTMRITRQPFQRPIPGAAERRRVRELGVGIGVVAALGVLTQILLQLPLVEWAYDVIAVAAGVVLLLAAAIFLETNTLTEPEEGLTAAVTQKRAVRPTVTPWPSPSLPGAGPFAGSSDPDAGLGTGVDENGEPYGRIG
ncbi:hypothetical protein [Polyangium sorediatum]|uniref:RING-type E3 ubiquitin transferase n=1 Tax=Polyangium sorediatum TaxID=889274 RepID=A0ABT6NSU1_9BACT|nr:hypothetical protein [Polyangium sorediatum]MDI1431373.1 hypothetical protein [Polyangium sorediatum]